MKKKSKAPKVLVVEEAGFCFGVKRAIKIASDAAKKSKERVYTLGPLIHNPQVVEDLARKGVCVTESINDLNGTIIIRSHGIHPKILRKIKNAIYNTRSKGSYIRTLPNSKCIRCNKKL